jgi:hypothetical protein
MARVIIAAFTKGVMSSGLLNCIGLGVGLSILHMQPPSSVQDAARLCRHDCQRCGYSFPLKRWYPPSRLRGVTATKTAV